jgi:hypothetical protein
MYVNKFSKQIGVTLSIYTLLTCVGFSADAKEDLEKDDKPAAMNSLPCPLEYAPEDFPAIELLRSVDLDVTQKNIDAANAVLCVGAPSENITARDIMFFVQQGG